MSDRAERRRMQREAWKQTAVPSDSTRVLSYKGNDEKALAYKAHVAKIMPSVQPRNERRQKWNRQRRP